MSLPTDGGAGPSDAAEEGGPGSRAEAELLTLKELRRSRAGEEAAREAERASAERLLAVEQRLAAQLAAAEELEQRLDRETAALRGELTELAAQSERQQRVIDGITGSLSWRLTRPLRLAKRASGSARDY
jgi:septal ring factor EnvC (AmiA/AmiB activator)